MQSTALTAGTPATIQQYNKLRSDAKGAALLSPHEASTPAMSVVVEPGFFYNSSGTQVDCAGGTATIGTASANPRYDLVSINNSGSIVVTAGTPGASPVKPTLPANNYPICYVYVRVGTTVIRDDDQGSNGYIIEARPIMTNPSASVDVLGTLLAGISFATSTPITSADSLLIACGKLQAQLSNFSALPAQTGNAGKYLMTDGNVASWSNGAGGYYVNTLIGNGSTTTLPLSFTPLPFSLVIYGDGMKLIETTDYTVSGTTVTFTSAPPTGITITAVYCYQLGAMLSISGIWGTITGAMSAQTDLVAALAGKASSTHTHISTDITDFIEATQDALYPALVHSYNQGITVAYDDANNRFTFAVSSSINAQTGTTYTFVAGDAANTVTLNNAAAITATVPPNSVVAFPIGTQIDVVQLGAGKVTLAQGAGVTINSKGGNKSLSAQYVGGTLKKIATDTWLLFGDLVA